MDANRAAESMAVNDNTGLLRGDHTFPNRVCDIVMKGGITSGIIYPPAVHEIARSFQFVGIAGTSAGAIAAALTAAAEYRRRRNGGTLEGFEQLETTTKAFNDPKRLLALFRPDHETRKLHALAISAMEHSRRKKKRTVQRSRGEFSRGKAYQWASQWTHNLLLDAYYMTRFGLLALSDGASGRVAENNYGLCSGMANGNRPQEPGQTQPLTQWLHDSIQEIATGRRADGGPLTFSDLWNAGPPMVSPGAAAEGGAPASPLEVRKHIDFRVVTTCITFGRPFELPFGDSYFYFRPSVWERLFPPDVVDHLEQRGQVHPDDADLYRLPPAESLPIIVAARMSLSFPILFSMVPMVAMNPVTGTFEDVWFSDGGITSNIPMHRFDSILPGWPTLGINLQYADDEGNFGRKGVTRDNRIWMHPRTDQTQAPRNEASDLFHRFDTGQEFRPKFFRFGTSIFRSAQVWHDNEFLKMPGYRDRVVEIWLDGEEGGLNLKMPGKTVEKLLTYGREAGRRLVERFTGDEQAWPEAWEQHRWTRFGVGMAGLIEALNDFADSTHGSQLGNRALAEVLTDEYAALHGIDEPARLVHVRAATESLIETVRAIRKANPEVSAPEAATEFPVLPDQPWAARWPFDTVVGPVAEFGSRAPMGMRVDSFQPSPSHQP